MTSRPAVPESDTPTPLSDAFTEELLRMAGTPWGWSDEERKDLRRRILESHESLERHLSLAQTEIKDWKIAFDGLIAAAEVKTATINGLQARISGLEKALLDIALCRMGPPDQHGTVSMDEYGPWVRNVARQAIGEAAIDAALKSRA